MPGTGGQPGEGEKGPRAADRAADHVERVRERDPQRVLPGQGGGGADDLADRVVGAQQRPDLLLGAVGGLGPQHDPGALHLRLEGADRGLDLPAGVVQLRQLAGRREPGIGQRGDQRERLGDLAGGVPPVVLDDPGRDVGGALLAQLAGRPQPRQVRPVGQHVQHRQAQRRAGPPQQLRPGGGCVAPQLIAAKFEPARHSIPGPSRPISCRARVFSPVRQPPWHAAISARVPHSASASSRTCGNAPRSLRPSAPLVDGPPNRSQFAPVSWQSSVVPSSDTSRSPRQNAPAMPGRASSPAAFSNSSRSGAGPSRARALDNASSDGTATVTPRSAQASTPAIFRITRPAPISMNKARAREKYTVSHAGSSRLRRSRAPAASTASSTAPRGNAPASTPTEILSPSPPSSRSTRCPALAT